jgi:polyphosphate glucokinase
MRLEPAMRILVLDVGGTNVKLTMSGRDGRIKLPSGPTLGPQEMVARVLAATAGWAYDVISMGYPGPVRDGRPWREPVNLAPGWVGFDFEGAFGRPVRLLNDAAMQALGSYEGGHMLFLGLGTGLGSALVSDGIVCPLELGHLPYRGGRSFEDYVGSRGLARLGQRRWRHHVSRVVPMLIEAVNADYAILGGGNARRVGELPPNVRLGHNSRAILGGFRLWEGVGAE